MGIDRACRRPKIVIIFPYCSPLLPLGSKANGSLLSVGYLPKPTDTPPIYTKCKIVYHVSMEQLETLHGAGQAPKSILVWVAALLLALSFICGVVTCVLLCLVWFCV